MRRHGKLHYSETELLMHLLDEETPEFAGKIAAHLPECAECQAVFQEFREVERCIHSWTVKDLPEESWLESKMQLMEFFQQDRTLLHSKGIIESLLRAFQVVWDCAVENPISAIGYVALAIAFASARTIEVFRMQSMLPEVSQVIEILRKVL